MTKFSKENFKIRLSAKFGIILPIKTGEPTNLKINVYEYS